MVFRGDSFPLVLRLLPRLAGASLPLLAGALPASAQTRYTVEWLSDLGGGQSWVTAMNNVGQAVGWSRTPDGVMHAVRWTPGVGLEDLGLQGGVASIASGINDSGTTVGTVVLTWGPPRIVSRVWLWNAAGVGQDLGTLGGDDGDHGASAINNLGEVVGTSRPLLYYEDWSGRHYYVGDYRAFLWTSSSGMHSLGTIGTNQLAWSQAFGISDSGIIVGKSTIGGAGGAGAIHPFRWTQADGLVDLGLPSGGTGGEAAAVNIAGQIVGNGGYENGQVHAMSWIGTGPAQDLGGCALIVPQGTLFCGSTGAAGINSSGTIVGAVSTSATGGGMIIENGAMYLLKTLIIPANAFNLGGAVAINNAGQIAGNEGNSNHPYILTPCHTPSIQDQPYATETCPSGSATFCLTAAGTGTIAYQWQWEQAGAPGIWTNLAEGPNADSGAVVRFVATGAAADTLSIARDAPPQGALGVISALRCVVSNACGSVTSDTATLTVCAADYDCNSFVNGEDFDLFVDDFFFGYQTADVDENTYVNGDDFDYFVDHFYVGC